MAVCLAARGRCPVWTSVPVQAQGCPPFLLVAVGSQTRAPSWREPAACPTPAVSYSLRPLSPPPDPPNVTSGGEGLIPLFSNGCPEG